MFTNDLPRRGGAFMVFDRWLCYNRHKRKEMLQNRRRSKKPADFQFYYSVTRSNKEKFHTCKKESIG